MNNTKKTEELSRFLTGGLLEWAMGKPGREIRITETGIDATFSIQPHVYGLRLKRELIYDHGIDVLCYFFQQLERSEEHHLKQTHEATKR